MKTKMKKFGKMSSIFEFSISDLGYKELFIKIWKKKEVFFEIFTRKGYTRTEVLKGLVYSYKNTKI